MRLGSLWLIVRWLRPLVLSRRRKEKKRRGGRKRNETERREEKDTKKSIGRPSLAWLLRPSLPHPFCVSFSSHFLFFFEWTLHYCYAVQHCASAATKVFLYFFLCLPLLLLDPPPLTSSAGGSFFSPAPPHRLFLFSIAGGEGGLNHGQFLSVSVPIARAPNERDQTRPFHPSSDPFCSAAASPCGGGGGKCCDWTLSLWRRRSLAKKRE